MTHERRPVNHGPMATSARTGARFVVRACLTLVLLVGFYAVAFVIAAWAILGIFVLLYLERSSVLASVALLGVAGVSLATAFETLTASNAQIHDIEGIWLDRDQDPAIFELVDDLALRMGTRPPERIVLVASGSAFVTERGGWLGWGSERIMGIGYLQMRRSDVSELRAVLAHELGHFCAGDTFLGPLVARAHRTFVTASTRLTEEKPNTSRFFGVTLGRLLLRAVLTFYCKIALRVSMAAGRLHELEADRQAVRFGGRSAHERALARAAHDCVTFAHFVKLEVDPLMAEGKWPRDFWGGYDAFESSVNEEVAEWVRAEKLDPYDSHPTLAERLVFSATLDLPEVEEDSRSASSLLTSPVATWTALDRKLGAKLPRADWSEGLALREKDVRRTAKDMFGRYLGLLRGPSWLHMARGGVRCLRAEGAYRMTVRVDPGMSRLRGETWEAIAPPVFARTFGSILAMALTEGLGGTFVHVFGKPIHVDLHGERLCPSALAADAARSEEGLERLATLLGADESADGGGATREAAAAEA